MAATHTREIKVRLSDEDADFLMQIAKRTGQKPAVIARAWLKKRINQHLHQVSQSFSDKRRDA